MKERCRVLIDWQFAETASVDPANLSHVLSGKRRPSRAMLAKREKALAAGARSRPGCRALFCRDLVGELVEVRGAR